MSKTARPCCLIIHKITHWGSLIGWLNVVQCQADPDLYLEEKNRRGELVRFRAAREATTQAWCIKNKKEVCFHCCTRPQSLRLPPAYTF